MCAPLNTFETWPRVAASGHAIDTESTRWRLCVDNSKPPGGLSTSSPWPKFLVVQSVRLPKLSPNGGHVPSLVNDVLCDTRWRVVPDAYFTSSSFNVASLYGLYMPTKAAVAQDESYRCS
jgi:hypothetical protein